MLNHINSMDTHSVY